MPTDRAMRRGSRGRARRASAPGLAVPALFPRAKAVAQGACRAIPGIETEQGVELALRFGTPAGERHDGRQRVAPVAAIAPQRQAAARFALRFVEIRYADPAERAPA